MASGSTRRLHFRPLVHVDSKPPHFLAAIQVIAHVVDPLRKALVHFYFLTNKEQGVEKKIEWRFLRALGKLIKELVAVTSSDSAQTSVTKDGDEEDETLDAPVDPTDFYDILLPTLEHLQQPNNPENATVALHILLETLQKCVRTLPLTSHLWVALLDRTALGLMGRSSVVGQCPLIEDGEILQRTQKETIMEWCPIKLPKTESLEASLQKYCGRQPYVYNFDSKPYQFEVRIPLLSPQLFEGSDASSWKTTKTVQYTELTTYLLFGIDRFAGGRIDESETIIPTTLDMRKYCDKTVPNTKFELVAGVLHDEGDYIALIRNSLATDKEDEEAWMLMESEEVIPMTEHDALDFLQGEDQESPCGTIAIYRRCEDGAELKSLLSDIIISQVSGSLDSASDGFYYEEEVIED